jgi:hypothetical protein
LSKSRNFLSDCFETLKCWFGKIISTEATFKNLVSSYSLTQQVQDVPNFGTCCTCSTTQPDLIDLIPILPTIHIHSISYGRCTQRAVV